jgi:Zn-dependent peptidase ImmA (M78 family)/transcriptional regulator with XRE-family HTH domain
MTRVAIHRDLIDWACERAGLSPSRLLEKFPRLEQWRSGRARPTLRQVEAFADTVHVPVGYLFLPQPPEEPLPLPDFRTLPGRRPGRPSPDLLDTLRICLERQRWFHEFAETERLPELSFIGSANTSEEPAVVAERIAAALHFDVAQRREFSTWSEALRRFIRQADDAGALVMVSGVVLNNNRRRLNPAEFRGFAIADRLAPLIFINGADSKAAQMFTLAHELAHLWLGQSALSDATAASLPAHQVEAWCNRVAAELLVPEADLRAALRHRESLPEAAARIARQFKVSSLVALRRLLDVGFASRRSFEDAWRTECDRFAALPRSQGGDFYLTTSARVSRRFVGALVASTLEGRTLYRDALRLLGVRKMETFHELARQFRFLP